MCDRTDLNLKMKIPISISNMVVCNTHVIPIPTPHTNWR